MLGRLNLLQCISVMNFVDLEDIQRKRRKQIPNFTIPDGFANSTGLIALLLFSLLKLPILIVLIGCKYMYSVHFVSRRKPLCIAVHEHQPSVTYIVRTNLFYLK